MAVNGIPLPKYLEDAFLTMEAASPSYPKDIIESLGAYQGDGHGSWHEQGRPYFKGWVGTVDGQTRYSTELGVYPEDLSNISYVGMWVGRTALGQVIFCVIPSMNTGAALEGQTVDMGKERVALGQYTQEELDGFVVRGWQMMQDMIDKYGEYTPKLKGSILPQA